MTNPMNEDTKDTLARSLFSPTSAFNPLDSPYPVEVVHSSSPKVAQAPEVGKVEYDNAQYFQEIATLLEQALEAPMEFQDLIEQALDIARAHA